MSKYHTIERDAVKSAGICAFCEGPVDFSTLLQVHYCHKCGIHFDDGLRVFSTSKGKIFTLGPAYFQETLTCSVCYLVMGTYWRLYCATASDLNVQKQIAYLRKNHTHGKAA